MDLRGQKKTRPGLRTPATATNKKFKKIIILMNDYMFKFFSSGKFQYNLRSLKHIKYLKFN